MDHGREDKNPWTQWYWVDWESDTGLKACGLKAQGLWMRMLSIMARASRKGYLLDGQKQMESKILAKLVGETEAEVNALLGELFEHGVPSKTDDGIIYNRRMVREARLSELRSRAGRLGGRPRKQIKSKGISKPKARSVSVSVSDSAFSNPEGDAGEGKASQFEPRHLDLARYLESAVRTNVPHHRNVGADYLRSWANTFRLMEERDKIPFESIRDVLEWALQDEFWSLNILSAGTYRDKYGRLEAKARAWSTSRKERQASQVGAHKGPASPESEEAARVRIEIYHRNQAQAEPRLKAAAARMDRKACQDINDEIEATTSREFQAWLEMRDQQKAAGRAS